jgi:radical SAM protein with 4Fe4S-binding SPASM domain
LIDVDPAAEKKYPNCFLYESLIIDYAGNAILCCNDYHSSIIFGNIAQDTLLNIWENKKYKKLRKRLRKRIYDLPICQICVGR